MASAYFHIKEHVLPCQHIREYARATAFKQEEELHLAIKQYIPIDNPSPQPGDVTIIGAHANGYPKELYEPLWIDLLMRAKASGFRIRGIWIADVAQQGASSVLNEHLLGNDPSWHDHARDLLHMINTFRTQILLPIVGIGHSMGACQLANLSLLHPRLLHSLILIEPVIQHFASSDQQAKYRPGFTPARLSTFRRDIWPSKAAVATAFRKQKYYQTWDPRVLDLWLEHGIRPTPTALYPDERPGAVTLTTTRHQEVWTFLRPQYDTTAESSPEQDDAYPDMQATESRSLAFYRPEPPIVFTSLPHLRPSALYIFGALSEVSGSDSQASKVNTTGNGTGGSGGVRAGRVKGLVFEDLGHLVPLEAVGRTADACAEWLAKELKRWEEGQMGYQEWTRLPLRERQGVDEEWKVKIGGPMMKAKI